ncbi:hypothetical protein [Amycolatopsis minnesotensis]|uniref:hypothetical protein n=1 Tax=Amycolatopsis minnesotensis TaxID=337894 RepID=UPI0031D647D9
MTVSISPAVPGANPCSCTRLAEGPAGQAVARVPVSSENVPARRILTCVRRGGRRNPLIDLGMRALEEAVREHQAAKDQPRSA